MIYPDFAMDIGYRGLIVLGARQDARILSGLMAVAPASGAC